MRTSVQFINHASVMVSDGNVSVLSDPWYSGDAFHKGWDLLVETKDREVKRILASVTHIWISHEHPDHFSIAFFKKFLPVIKTQSIKILFQKTKDRRVCSFLEALGLEVIELAFNERVSLSNNFQVICIKDGMLDSGLLIESNGEKILNLNDCVVRTVARAKEIRAISGEVDVLLTQFSYAAWKGGKENRGWRQSAAQEKIDAMALQIDIFNPRYVIPFASFVYFSNAENFYLNDSVNTPLSLKKKLEKYSSKLTLMAPFDTLGGYNEKLDSDAAVHFWEQKYQKIQPTKSYRKLSLNGLRESFDVYCDRITNNNNMLLIRLLRLVSPIPVFKRCVVHLNDLSLTVEFDYVTKSFKQSEVPAMISMQSESLDFIFKNSFGFDTLTVNGCFEEKKKGGFVQISKSLAIGTLNTTGIKVEFKTLLKIRLIASLLLDLYRVSTKLKA